MASRCGNSGSLLGLNYDDETDEKVVDTSYRDYSYSRSSDSDDLTESSTATPTTKTKPKSKSRCGTLGSNAQNNIALLLILLLPGVVVAAMLNGRKEEF